MLKLNKPFPPFRNPTNRVEESCRLCGESWTVGKTAPTRVRYQSGWEYTYDVCDACVRRYGVETAQTDVLTLKTSYNSLIDRIGAATEIIDGGKYPPEEKERYLNAFDVLSSQVANVLRQIKESGVDPTPVEIADGFDLGVIENATE
jgi:hypothetical protein